MNAQVIHGDCLEVLRTLPDNSVHAIVTDPPYGLGKEPDALAMLQDWLTTGHHELKGKGFMGKEWDAFVPQPAVWKECLRVLKPGGHLLSFAGTRTMDLVALGLRIAGFELRDTISWVYSSGFPKSHNVANAIDKMHAAGNRGHAIASGSKYHPTTGEARASGELLPKYEARTEAGKGWQGFGTALKPAFEPILLARKPLSGTVAQNVLEHGVGGLNIDGCRVGTEVTTTVRNGNSGANGRYGRDFRTFTRENPPGRWPANLIHDGSEEVVALFPETTGSSAARFFYCAKASKKDRDEGLEAFEAKMSGFSNGAQIHGEGYDKGQDIGLNRVIARRNSHPTVKPTDLMRYLCRLITPPSGTVLDPFCGSGSTGKAALLEGFSFIGIEREAEYVDIARARIAAAQAPLLNASDD